MSPGPRGGAQPVDLQALHGEALDEARRLVQASVQRLPPDLGPADEPAHVFAVDAVVRDAEEQR